MRRRLNDLRRLLFWADWGHYLNGRWVMRDRKRRKYGF